MTRPQSVAFKAYVLLVCAGWFAVPVAALWGLDWRWIPAALLAAVVLLLAGGLVENWRHERAEMQALARRLDAAKAGPPMWLTNNAQDREAQRAAIAAEEDAWLGSPEQPR